MVTEQVMVTNRADMVTEQVMVTEQAMVLAGY